MSLHFPGLSYLIIITVAAAAAAAGRESANDDEWRCKLCGVLFPSRARIRTTTMMMIECSVDFCRCVSNV